MKVCETKNLLLCSIGMETNKIPSIAQEATVRGFMG